MIRLLVDSSSDIQNNNSDGIFVVPLSIQINGKSYIDGVDISHDKFYDMLVQASEFPKTSQPSPQAFVKAYEQLNEDDELICFLLSSGVSGTYQSAALAKEISGNEKIHLVHTLTGTYGTKILVNQICEIEVDKAFPFYTIYTLGEKNVTKFEEKLNESGITVLEREQLGPVVESHVGPESFGCIFIAKNCYKIPF